MLSYIFCGQKNLIGEIAGVRIGGMKNRVCIQPVMLMKLLQNQGTASITNIANEHVRISRGVERELR